VLGDALVHGLDGGQVDLFVFAQEDFEELEEGSLDPGVEGDGKALQDWERRSEGHGSTWNIRAGPRARELAGRRCGRMAFQGHQSTEMSAGVTPEILPPGPG